MPTSLWVGLVLRWLAADDGVSGAGIIPFVGGYQLTRVAAVGLRALDMVPACWWGGPDPRAAGCGARGPGAGTGLLVGRARACGISELVSVHWWVGWVLGLLVGGAGSLCSWLLGLRVLRLVPTGWWAGKPMTLID